MATITVERTCGCFFRSGYEIEQTFATAEEARRKADEMIDDMNNNFCGKHLFILNAQSPEDLHITVKNRYE